MQGRNDWPAASSRGGTRVAPVILRLWPDTLRCVAAIEPGDQSQADT